MLDLDDADDSWADLNGSYGRCPSCHRQIWVESGCMAECGCGWDERGENEGEEEDGDE